MIFILLISACNNESVKTPEQVAQAFAVFWTQKDYVSAYNLFTPELKSLRNERDFVKFANAVQGETELSLIYDKIVKQNDNLAYAYYTASTGIVERKIPPITLEVTNEGWRINGYASYFKDNCADAYCSSYTLQCKEYVKECNVYTGFKCKTETKDIEPCSCDGNYNNYYVKNRCPSSEKPLCKNKICIKGECEYNFDCNESLFKDKCNKLGQDYEFRDVSCTDYKCVVGCRNIKTKTGSIYPNL